MRRLHPFVGLARVVQYGLYGFTIPIFGLSIARPVLGGSFPAWLPGLPIAAVGLFVGATYGVLSYLRFTYRVTEDTFDVHAGVIGRRERDIPHRRIQNVDVTRSIWQKLLGVATVRIETAGGGSTEATLDFLSLDEAERLQRVLTERRAAYRHQDRDTTPEDGAIGSETDAVNTPASADGEETHAEKQKGEQRRTPPSDSTPLFAISNTELALHVTTTFRLGTLALIVIGTPFVERWVSQVLLRAAAPFGGPERLVLSRLTPDQLVALAVVGVPMAVGSAWLLGAAINLNQYHGFELRRRGEELAYERGLLSEYSGSIPLSKVQTLTVTENVFQRPLGYAGLSIDTAGYAGGNSQQAGDRSAIPLASRERVVDLVDTLQGADLDVEFTRPPSRARERYAVRFGLALLAVIAITYGVSRVVGGFSLWWSPVVLAPLLPVVAHLRWKHRGYAVLDDHVLVRSGFLHRRTRVVPYDRLQTIARSRTVFQRRRNLANLVADTASGAVLNRGGAVAYDQDGDAVADLREQLRENLQASLQEGRT